MKTIIVFGFALGMEAVLKRPKFEFRQAQAAFDLMELVKSQDDQTLAKIGGADLVEVVRTHHCRFASETYEDCYSNLAGIALEEADNCALAMAILVANDLQRGLWAGSSVEFADLCLDGLKSAPNELRSAVLRGLDAEIDFPFQVTYPMPERILPNVCRLTFELEQVLPSLCSIAREMDEAARKSVSRADYGADADRHFEALNEVLDRETCLFDKEERWLPAEAVGLVSHVSGNSSFVHCTALLLANAVQTGDFYSDFSFRWMQHATYYNSMIERFRAPIIAGVRYLYETDCEFLSLEEREEFDPVLFPEKMIGAKVDLELLPAPG
ncbi:hypothetical protein [Cognatishimia activa]|uniref:Uncharacterized protein n=1 Tax=Cognatishimia activa TaxID=1715691 RepID=A0A0P1IS75_9RHOB|nr:hypothetical protein [Cognatishimia activa]CUI61653.1 hypothetical protein TA5113_00943 [Cognatishimia activa]CUK26306.1 hypothetical protein TA5114_02115 [Cognatishimia activa]